MCSLSSITTAISKTHLEVDVHLLKNKFIDDMTRNPCMLCECCTVHMVFLLKLLFLCELKP